MVRSPKRLGSMRLGCIKSCSPNEDFGTSKNIRARHFVYAEIAQLYTSAFDLGHVPLKVDRKIGSSSSVHPSQIFVWGTINCLVATMKPMRCGAYGPMLFLFLQKDQSDYKPMRCIWSDDMRCIWSDDVLVFTKRISRITNRKPMHMVRCDHCDADACGPMPMHVVRCNAVQSYMMRCGSLGTNKISRLTKPKHVSDAMHVGCDAMLPPVHHIRCDAALYKQD